MAGAGLMRLLKSARASLAAKDAGAEAEAAMISAKGVQGEE